MSNQVQGERNEELEEHRRRLQDRLAELDPAMIPDELLNLARAMTSVEAPEVSCEACQAWLPSYVDAEIAGLPAAEEYPAVQRHLNLCADCEAEYLAMLELAVAEEAGELPVPERFPEPNLGFLPTLPLPVYVRTRAHEIVDAIAPRLTEDLQVVADVFFEHIEALGEGFRLRPEMAQTLDLGGETTEALQMLATTYIATQVVVTELSPSEIEAQAETGELSETLRRQAEQAARNLDLEQAQAFAEQYAERVCQDPEVLQELAARSANSGQ